jgi:hypothetical protein
MEVDSERHFDKVLQEGQSGTDLRWASTVELKNGDFVDQNSDEKCYAKQK